MTTAVVTAEEPSQAATAPQADRSFLRWGAATYGLVLAVLLVASLRASDGRLVYVIDDPAIHMSLAGNLVDHGTWGVEPQHFAAASSSPLWTLLVAAYMVVSPLGDALGPLLLNVAAAVALIAVLGANQTVLRPSRRRPLDAAAVAVLVAAVLFLPALTLVGMEHILHMALTLAAVALVHRASRGETGRWPRWLPYALIALATFTRLETTFVAAGLAVAIAARALPGWGDAGVPLRPALRQAVLVGAAAAVPLAVVAGFGEVMGEGPLPNSVLAKAQPDGEALRHSFLHAGVNRLTTDPLLAALTVLAVAGLIFAWRQRRSYAIPAIVFVVATALHVCLARIGWYERYQAYLIALGVYAALQMAGEVLPAERRTARPALVPLLVLVSLLFTATKLSLTAEVPIAVSDTYEQRFQAGRFLARYYDGQPVATGELGYVTLMHDGPVTDLLGLGDHEVLEERRATGNDPPTAYWEDLARRRGFEVVAVYPSTLSFDTPSSWVLVGEWWLPGTTVTAFEPTFQFWATIPEAVAPLGRQLEEFAADMPDRVEYHPNELAALRADQLMNASADADGDDE